MQILLISASERSDGATAAALGIAKGVIEETGAACKQYTVPNRSYACSGCGACKRSGFCIHGDLDPLYELISESDGLMIATPTHYCGANPALSATLSRLFMSKIDIFKRKPAAFISVGRRAGLFPALADSERFFSFSASPIANGVYPAIYYGSGDTEGEESIVSLTENLLWLIEAITLMKKSGASEPRDRRSARTDLRSLIALSHQGKEE